MAYRLSRPRRPPVYHRHSHDTYSFGVTETGAQSFTCRRAGHTSAAGMVMAFNPDDPHDGRAATGGGFSYRMIHIGPPLLARGQQVRGVPGIPGQLRAFTQRIPAPDPAAGG